MKQSGFAAGMLVEYGNLTEDFLEQYQAMQGIFEDIPEDEQEEFAEMKQMFDDLRKAIIKEMQA